MTRRDVIDLGLMAVGLAALLARVVALALADLDEALRDFRVDGPQYVPCDWEVEVDES